MSLADHKSTQREELSTLKKLFAYLWLSYMAFKYCMYYVSTPSLHRESTKSLMLVACTYQVASVCL